MPYDPLLPAYDPATDTWVIGRIVYPEDMARLSTRVALQAMARIIPAPGTTVGTYVAGNDSRIPTGNAGTAMGAAMLDATGKLPSNVVTMPLASATTVGGIKSDGATIVIAADGTTSVVGTATVPWVGALVPGTDAILVQRGVGVGALTGPATAVQVTGLLGQVPVAGVGAMPSGTAFPDVTGTSWTIEAYVAKIAALNAPALMLTMPTGVLGGTSYVIVGTFINDGTAPILTVSVDAGAFGTLPAGSTATNGVINLLMPGIATGMHTVQIKDGNGILSNTVSFAAVAPETLTVTTPATQMVGTAFAVAGTYAGGAPSALDWSLDGTTWTASTGTAPSAGTYSIPGVLVTTANASQNLRVRDHGAQSIVAISAAFAVVATEAITVTTPAAQVAGTAFAVAGTYTGAVPAALDWSLDGTTWTASTGAAPATGTYSIPAVTVATGNPAQTVRVRDRSVPSVSGTSAAFAVTAAPATAATLATVPTTGMATQAITGATDTLTPANATAYACLFTAAADVGTRVAFSGTTMPALTPAAAGSFTIRVYAAATGGAALAESPAITVAAAETITVTTPTAQAAGTAFAVAGTYTNGPPAALDWSVDGTTWTASTGAAPATGAYSIPGVMVANANASQTVRVRDRAVPGIIGTSAAFTVTPVVATAATLATVPTTGTVNVAITGVTDTLTPANAMAYACLFTSAADVGTRVAFTGTAVPALTPVTAASYTIRLYAAATGGVALAESAAIAVSAAANAIANTLQITAIQAVSNVSTALTGGTFTLANTYGGYNYGDPFNFFSLTKGGTAVATTSTTVVSGYSTSATTPPPLATHPVSSTLQSNGYFGATANSATNFNQNSDIAVIVGSAPSPGVARYFWVSDDNAATWSVHRNGSNVAYVYMVIG